MSKVIDYDSLANQARTTPIDYDALASQVRGKTVATPAKGVGDGSGNYTQDMSAAQIASNQFLNVLEGLGVDLQHPIMGTARNFIKGGGDAVERIQKAPVSGTLGLAKDALLAPANAIGNVLSGNDEQAARGAGQFLASTPIAAAELGGIEAAGRAGFGAAKVGAKAALNKVTTPESLAGRAVALREPLPKTDMSNIVPRATRKAAVGTVGTVVGGPLGGVAAEAADAALQSQPVRNARAALFERLAKNMTAGDTVDMGNPAAGSAQFMPETIASTIPEGVQLESPAKPSVPPPSSAELNKWMNVREKQLVYGNNPAEQIIKDNLLGADKASTLANVSSARKSVGAQMEGAFKSAEENGVRFDVDSQIQDVVADARKTYGVGSDEAFMKQLDNLQDQFVQHNGDLKSMTPSEAHTFEKDLSKGINFDSAATSDVARVLKDLRGRVNKMLKSDVPGIADLKDRWGNLYEAEKSLKSSLRKDAIGKGTGSAFDQLKSKLRK